MYLTTSIPRTVLARVRDGARSGLVELLANYRWRVEQEPDRLSRDAPDAVLTQLCRLEALMHLSSADSDESCDRLLDPFDGDVADQQ
ncbi:MAG TPA: hypothetical protein VFW38_09885 [Solirubrobacteraceae bacterium]|nr:hypothetical protein [Solirubrobacteraceae bacterium]